MTWLAWWAFHLSDSLNDCPTTSCTRPDACGSLVGNGGRGRVMKGVQPAQPLRPRRRPGLCRRRVGCAVLNRSFEAVAAAVLEQEGLLDKVIGDAVMAELEAPSSHRPKHRLELRNATRAP
ncbi:hypothetical protein H6G65_02920 [Microcystis elabens FACHB-917]|nr:hypothetical protein [Microcystis elabens FACHB-917]